jgi:hypothetical protein
MEITGQSGTNFSRGGKREHPFNSLLYLVGSFWVLRPILRPVANTLLSPYHSVLPPVVPYLPYKFHWFSHVNHIWLVGTKKSLTPRRSVHKSLIQRLSNGVSESIKPKEVIALYCVFGTDKNNLWIGNLVVALIWIIDPPGQSRFDTRALNEREKYSDQ